MYTTPFCEWRVTFKACISTGLQRYVYQNDSKFRKGYFSGTLLIVWTLPGVLFTIESLFQLVFQPGLESKLYSQLHSQKLEIKIIRIDYE